MAVFQSRTVHPIHTQPVTGTHTEAIDDTVAEWQRTGVLIPRGAAQAIASWWQAPGNAFSAFSHTGAVLDGLSGEIRAALADRDPDTGAPMAGALLALSAYVGACTVSPYAVTHNAPGYLPDTAEPDMGALDYAQARQAFEDLLREAPEILHGDVDCECGDAELCPPCATEAEAAAIIRDGDGAPYAEPAGAGEWGRSVYLYGDDGGLGRVFVITRTPMLARDFFAGTGDPLPTPDAALAGTGATVAGAA